MNSLTNYVDVSTKSLVIAGIVFLIVSLVAKYIFESNDNSDDPKEKRSVYITIVYCVIIGLIFAGLSLILSKQFCNFGTCEILEAPFKTSQ